MGMVAEEIPFEIPDSIGHAGGGIEEGVRTELLAAAAVLRAPDVMGVDATVSVRLAPGMHATRSSMSDVPRSTDK